MGVDKMFNGILIEKDEAGYRASYQSLSEEILPAGDVTVAVQWSSLNYKDGLALTGAAPVVRRFPLIPGIDFAGTVLESQHPDWHPGDKVVLNGWGVGAVAYTHLTLPTTYSVESPGGVEQ